MKLAPSSPREWIFASLRIVSVLAVVFVLLFGLVGYTTWMPGWSTGELSTLTLDTAEVETRGRLARHVQSLASTIGERNTRHPKAYAAAAKYIRAELRACGLEPVDAPFRSDGQDVVNIVATIPGASTPSEIVVVGAHYDTVRDTPGADDNASGTAVVIELACRFARAPGARTLRFVLFANEEPPAFQNDDMGSLVYARACRAASDDIRAMISVESVGFFTNDEDSQQLPSPVLAPFMPDEGDFLAFVSNLGSRSLLRRAIGVFRENCEFPTEGITAPEWVSGIGFSDHWSFWQVGYPAFMVTDTALFRNGHYHKPSDLPATLHSDGMTRVTSGVEAVVRDLITEPLDSP